MINETKKRETITLHIKTKTAHSSTKRGREPSVGKLVGSWPTGRSRKPIADDGSNPVVITLSLERVHAQKCARALLFSF